MAFIIVKIHDAVFHSCETERLRLHEGLFDRFSAANQYRLPVKTLTLHKCFNYEILHSRQGWSTNDVTVRGGEF